MPIPLIAAGLSLLSGAAKKKEGGSTVGNMVRGLTAKKEGGTKLGNLLRKVTKKKAPTAADVAKQQSKRAAKRPDIYGDKAVEGNALSAELANPIPEGGAAPASFLQDPNVKKYGPLALIVIVLLLILKK